MRKAWTILTLWLAFSPFLIAQVRMHLAYETGLSVSSLPLVSIHANPVAKTISLPAKPVFPLAGFHGILSLNERFSLSAGIQFQVSGHSFYTYEKGRIPRDTSAPLMYTYTDLEWRELAIWKLCLPLQMTIHFGHAPMRPALSLDIRPNYMLLARYQKVAIQDAAGNSHDYIYVDNYNLFDPDIPTFSYTRRLYLQLLAGFSMNFRDNFILSSKFNIGYYGYYGFPKNIDDFVVHPVPWVDFGISLTYLLDGRKEKPRKK